MRARSKRCIFENELVEALAVQFKRNRDLPTYEKICAQSVNLMDSIIRRERFDQFVPFDDIRNFLFVQFERWIIRWVPGDGPLYSYIGVCIKHGCISYVTREKTFRTRYIHTDVPLEAFSDRQEWTEQQHGILPKEVIWGKLESITCRWREAIYREVIRYSIRTIIEGRAQSRRSAIVATIVDGYGLSNDMARFLFDWSIGAVRIALLEHYDSPVTEQDLILIRHRFSDVADLADIIGQDAALKLMKVWAGRTVRFPSPKNLQELVRDSVEVEKVRRDGVRILETQKPEATERMVMDFVEKVHEGHLETSPVYPAGHDLSSWSEFEMGGDDDPEEEED